MATTSALTAEFARIRSMSDADLAAYLAAQATPARKITMKVTAAKLDEKSGEMKGTTGAIALYGLGRFPVTLYRSQWERLLDEADTIRAFIVANSALLATKD